MDIAGMHLGVFDLISIGILIFFFVIGVIKGFTLQVIRLLTFVVALILAKNYAGTAEPTTEPSVARYLLDWFPNQFGDNREMAVYAAYFLIFVTAFILGTLIAFFLRAVLKRLELRSYDRLLGGLLGLVVGAVCIVVLVSLTVSFWPDADVTKKIGSSRTYRLSARVIKVAKPFFPKELSEKIENALKNLPGHEDKSESTGSKGEGNPEK